jgi:L-fucose isomerase-like protein
MSLRVLPVDFAGLRWGHPEHKHGRRWRPQEQIPDKLRMYAERLEGIELLELCTLEGKDDAPGFLKLAAEADAVVCVHSELLAAVWAAEALAQSPVPVILHANENAPGAVISDIYGYLHADGCNTRLALNISELRAMLGGLAAKKRLAETRALIVGDAFPSWSQAASPESLELVRDRTGMELVGRSMDEFTALFDAADEAEAEAQAKEWLGAADRIEAREAVEQDIVPIARVYLAAKQMIEETEANAFSIDCRTWDEQTMERFGRFYGPCLAHTTLRFNGIPAACEADVCALLALCSLTYVSGLPAFMGNITQAVPEESWLGVGGHASAAANMDGSADKLEGYWLTDYGGRGTGCASYCAVPEGIDVTFARFDKNLENISFATGVTRETDRCFEVAMGDVDDFVHRCLVGDHHGVVYGNHALALRVLAEELGMGVLEAGKPWEQ